MPSLVVVLVIAASLSHKDAVVLLYQARGRVVGGCVCVTGYIS